MEINGSFVRVLLLLLLPLFVACKVDIPEDVIKPDNMEGIIYDYHLVQVMTADLMSTSYEKKLHLNYVFDKHGITKEQFDSSLVWYTRYPKRMVKIYANLEKRTMAELEAMGEGGAALADIANSEKMIGDTVELWNDARVKLLSSSPLNNRIAFNYVADTTYVKGDSILFSFTARRLRGKMDSLRQTAHAALVVEYADKSFASRGASVTADSAFHISVARNYDSDIESMHGFVYYADNDTLCASKLLLGDISVKRIHPAEE